MGENTVFSHRSVLLDECIESLNIKPDGIYVDGTAGGGGHSLEIVKRLDKGGKLCALLVAKAHTVHGLRPSFQKRSARALHLL